MFGVGLAADDSTDHLVCYINTRQRFAKPTSALCAQWVPLRRCLDRWKGVVHLEITLDSSLSTKQLRQELPRIVERVRRGEKFTVLYRSRPAFRIVPVTGATHDEIPLEQDPLFHAPPVGHSTDGFTSRDHDRLIYGKSRR